MEAKTYRLIGVVLATYGGVIAVHPSILEGIFTGNQSAGVVYLTAVMLLTAVIGVWVWLAKSRRLVRGNEVAVAAATFYSLITAMAAIAVLFFGDVFYILGQFSLALLGLLMLLGGIAFVLTGGSRHVKNTQLN